MFTVCESGEVEIEIQFGLGPQSVFSIVRQVLVQAPAVSPHSTRIILSSALNVLFSIVS